MAWNGSHGPATRRIRSGGSETEAKRNIVEAVKETARQLGNRPAACRKYYVHPAVFESYMEQTIFKAMQNGRPVSSKALAGLRREEIAVLHLVESHRAPKKHS